MVDAGVLDDFDRGAPGAKPRTVPPTWFGRRLVVSASEEHEHRRVCGFGRDVTGIASRIEGNMRSEPGAIRCADTTDRPKGGDKGDGSAPRRSHQCDVRAVDTGMGGKETERGKDVGNTGCE